MRWSSKGMSKNVEDRRGMGMAPMGIGGAILMLVLSLVFGQDFIGSGSEQSAGGDVAVPIQETPEERERAQLVSNVLDDAQEFWAGTIKDYREAKLVLFRNATSTGCGTGQSAMGPFYCPTDEKVYIDLSFYDQLRDRFGADGDFAQAYVIAHEIGHHVQHLLGTDAILQRSGRSQAASIALELQADCYAGVWGGRTTHLETGDVEEGLAAAAAVGDDRIQANTTGHVNTDTFTHGSARQRVEAFKKGMDSGDPRVCQIRGQ
jgi:predicted metalloprotease